MTGTRGTDAPPRPDHDWVHPGLPPAPAGRPSLSDLGTVALAAATASGAWWAHPLPRSVGATVLVVAVVRRRPALLVVGAFLLAAALGHRAEAGLRPPDPGPFLGVVTLVSDPRDTPWGVRADVRAGSKRYELQADGGAAGTVGRALAGERLRVEGRLSRPPPSAPWLKPRHVVGRLVAETAELHDAGTVAHRAANRLRRHLQRGAAVMHEPARSLYGGFVLGDDRGQTPETVDDFRGAGLTHLLVVSGSNVAYLLVLAAPLTSRLTLWPRWGATIAVVVSFALVTRFEPSILRASAMAAVAVTASLDGRPTPSVRILALAVAGLLLVDPLLVHSVGFQLSVAASAGIVALSRPLADTLPGPRWVRDALGVTLAAQLAVAPVLIPRFGGMPVVAIAANLVAVPAAGVVTTWGLPAGLLAGLLGPGIGRWLHLPTSACIDWVAGTARVAAGLPFGELELPGLVVVVAAGAGLVVSRRSGSMRSSSATILRAGSMALAVAALVAPALALRHPPFRAEPLPGVTLYRTGAATVVAVEAVPTPAAALEALRRAGVRRIDVLVMADASPALLRALRHRWAVGRVIGGGAGVDLRVGDLRVRVVPAARSWAGADDRPRFEVVREPP